MHSGLLQDDDDHNTAGGRAIFSIWSERVGEERECEKRENESEKQRENGGFERKSSE